MNQPPVCRNPVSWSLRLRRMIDGISIALMQAFMLARERALSSGSPTVRELARRDAEAWETELRGREIAVFQRRLDAMVPARRPHVPPQDRFEILQLMRLRELSVDDAARRYVIHSNTLREWIRRFQIEGDVGGFFGKAPFNKIADSVRWLVHEIRRLCVEKEFGTRSIALAIQRAGIALSRSSVQRFLRKPAPPAPTAETAESERPQPATPTVTHGILRPKAKNRTWHLDLATFEFLWVRFYVAVLVDGFTRKLLASRVYRDAPSTRNMVALVRANIREFGTPRFLVTDHGCQFRARFKDAMKSLKIAQVKGRKRTCTFNGKCERFFKTLRVWQRLTIFAWKIPSIQKRLDSFRDWYNTLRPMQVLDGRTPDETWLGKSSPAATPFRANDPVRPMFTATRRPFRGDPRLPVLDISIVRHIRRSA